MNGDSPWDAAHGTAGGDAFGAALEQFARERDVSIDRLAAACGMDAAAFSGVLAGTMRVGISALARLAIALRSKPIEFMQKTGFLSLEVYASGLDPLFFLPDGQVRYDARIYMREINPRHQVPEADMTRRNPALKAVSEDSLLDAAGKVEVELAYLLHLAAQQPPSP